MGKFRRRVAQALGKHLAGVQAQGGAGVCERKAGRRVPLLVYARACLSCLARERWECRWRSESMRKAAWQKQERTGRRTRGGWGKRTGEGYPVDQAEHEGGSVPDLRRLTGDLGCSNWEQETLWVWHRPWNEQDEGELSPSGFQSPASLLGTLKWSWVDQKWLCSLKRGRRNANLCLSISGLENVPLGTDLRQAVESLLVAQNVPGPASLQAL